MTTSVIAVAICYAAMAAAMHGHAALFVALFLMWGFAVWAVSFGNLMCWPDLLPRHMLAVGGAAINTVSQLGAFLMPYAWGAARDASGGFKIGLIGLAIGSALAVLVALAARAQARQRRLELQPV